MDYKESDDWIYRTILSPVYEDYENLLYNYNIKIENPVINYISTYQEVSKHEFRAYNNSYTTTYYEETPYKVAELTCQ